MTNEQTDKIQISRIISINLIQKATKAAHYRSPLFVDANSNTDSDHYKLLLENIAF